MLTNTSPKNKTDTNDTRTFLKALRHYYLYKQVIILICHNSPTFWQFILSNKQKNFLTRFNTWKRFYVCNMKTLTYIISKTCTYLLNCTSSLSSTFYVQKSGNQEFFSKKSGGYQEFFSIKSNDFIQNYK